MSTLDQVRIVCRIRPLLKNELECHVVVKSERNEITIPNPKNASEIFTFPFSTVYTAEADQARIFEAVSPTLKHLFKGNDVTIFAYGATGSGKSHTMKGNKPAAERGIIPRLLQAIWRRGKDLEKKSNGETKMTAIMSYYEIYNDKVFDLLEAPEKRTLAGLPVRDMNGRTYVCGLVESQVSTLKEFETVYDKANDNRATSSTKLNAHSSRSHAVFCVKVQLVNESTGEKKEGTVSCIDLAGSEDNRRTGNIDKERLTESSAINKSLFTLGQCVEAMMKKQKRVPYRESKMTRILSLGQNNGLCVMVLNLAPTRAFLPDTLSALNFAARAKKIELKNEAPPKIDLQRQEAPSAVPGYRQPLGSGNGALAAPAVRSFGTNKTNTSNNAASLAAASNIKKKRKSADTTSPQKAIQPPLKQRSISTQAIPLRPQHPSGIKKPAIRTSDNGHHGIPRLQHKPANPALAQRKEEDLDAIVTRKVEEILAARALNEASVIKPINDDDINEKVNRRLEKLEKLVDKKADARAEGLTYILLAKQHAARGEDLSALKMYQVALTFFPDNPKLQKKIRDLKAKREAEGENAVDENPFVSPQAPSPLPSFHATGTTPRAKPVKKKAFAVFADHSDGEASYDDDDYIPTPPPRMRSSSVGDETPRTRRLLKIINSENVSMIQQLKGVGKKRAEVLAKHVKERRGREEEFPSVRDLEELALIRGIGKGMVASMREGLGQEVTDEGEEECF